MTFYDFLPVICINSPVPSLSPAQARRSRKVCQCYGKDLPAVSCVHCVHLFQFSEFPDCLDSMHAHLCVAICCNMLEYVAFSCVFPFQHSLPAQKKTTRPASKTLFRFSHSRELQLGPGQGQLGALYKLPQRLELDHEAQCPAK